MTMRLDAQIAEQASTSLVEAGRAVDDGARSAARRLPGRRNGCARCCGATSIWRCSDAARDQAARSPAPACAIRLFASCSMSRPPGEAVAIDCETTGLDPRRDDIVTVAAVPIRGSRILASERFEAMVRPSAKMKAEAIKVHRLREGRRGRRPNDGGGAARAPALHRLAAARRLLSRIRRRDGQQARAAHARDRASQPHGSRSRGSTTSASTATRRRARRSIFDSPRILADLGLPMLDQHDAFSDALMTAMMYVALVDLKDAQHPHPAPAREARHPFRRRVSVRLMKGPRQEAAP